MTKMGMIPNLEKIILLAKCQNRETTAQVEGSAEMERREVRIGGGIDEGQDGRTVDLEGGAGQRLSQLVESSN